MSAPERTLADSIRYVKGVGPAREVLLGRLGIFTAEDLLFFFPRRYEDRSVLTPLASLRPGETLSAIARVVALERRKTAKRNLSIATALVSDGKAVVKAVWFNRPGIERYLVPGVRVALYGAVEARGGAVQFSNPEYEVLDEDEDPEDALGIVPIYPATAGLAQKTLRRVMRTAMEEYLPLLEEFLPDGIRRRNDLGELRPSVRELHFPTTRDGWREARRRLAFDELFLLQTGLAMRRHRSGDAPKALPLSRGPLVQAYLERHLPFTLTEGQRRAAEDIFSDMRGTVPMNRLLQGDVGSGKTVVAVLALLAALDGGAQGAFLAPTEILSKQHYDRMRPSFEALGVSCALLTGSLPQKEKKGIHDGLESGDISVVIGTHALLSEGVSFARLGVAVVDEQHRFGVLQKQTFRSKGESPHVLVMTATPIPRTLTLTVFGDLSVSVIPELPPGRKPVVTRAISPKRLPGLLRFLGERMEAGERVFWICPLIKESEKMDLAAATARYEHLAAHFQRETVGLLHGRMSGAEKDAVMGDFQRGALSLLVSTTVVEVGVDVPEATVMVVEDATRFGLSQLHQLRGRVGRGDREGHCILIASPSLPEARERIASFCATTDGFLIAEADLKLRGPGEVCGVRQSGITDFRVADLLRDRKLLDVARSEAFTLVAGDPGLVSEPALKRRLFTALGRSLNLVETA